MTDREDKRERLRVAFETQVQLEFKSMALVLDAKMKNISINGIFVETSKMIPLNTACHIQVIVSAPNSKLTIETEGFVSRQDPSGLGVKFKNNMEWFAFFPIFEHYGKSDVKSE